MKVVILNYCQTWEEEIASTVPALPVLHPMVQGVGMILIFQVGYRESKRISQVCISIIIQVRWNTVTLLLVPSWICLVFRGSFCLQCFSLTSLFSLSYTRQHNQNRLFCHPKYFLLGMQFYIFGNSFHPTFY